jgi:hypothetical protein
MPFYPQNPNPRSYRSSPRPIYRERRSFQPHPRPTYQGPRRVTPGRNFRPPQQYSQRPSKWNLNQMMTTVGRISNGVNLDQMMTTVGKISNGVSTLKQMGSFFSSFRK